MNWSAVPFLRLSAALIAGILLKEYLTKLQIASRETVLFGAIIFIIYLILVRLYKRYRVRTLISTFSFISFAMLGFMTATLWDSAHKPPVNGAELEAVSEYTVTIRSKPSPTEKTMRYEGLIDRLKIDSIWIEAGEKAILYFMGDSTNEYRFGDQLLVRGSPTFVQHNTNPHAFDYGKYLQRRGIYLQDFVESHNSILIGASDGPSIKSWSMRAGDHLEGLLEKYIHGPREFQVAKAMVLGRREEITSEMEFVYQSTGTSHVLAVSGLHVGIIYILFSFVFKHLQARNKWVYNAIVLLAIWSFAFITGLSPSVQRAAWMFTIFVFSRLISRRSNTYNSILASAFIMLLFSPNLLFSVSFQLSYLAVFGIVYMYDLIYRQLYFKHAAIDFFWKITCVSVAVQLATFPLTIYYFKQFPTLFFVTNLVAIPTAMVVLTGSMLLFAGSFIAVVASLIGELLGWWIYLYNEILLQVSQFSFAAIEDLHLKGYAVFTVLLLTFLLIRLLQNRDVLVFKALVFVLVVFSGVCMIDVYSKGHQKQFVVYDIRNDFHFDIFDGVHCYTSHNGIDDASLVSYNITPNRKFNAVRTVQPVEKYALARKIGSNLLVSLDGKNILILNEPGTNLEYIAQSEVEYLIINRKSLRQIGPHLPNLSISHLILDNSVSASDLRKLIQVDHLPFRVHSIRKDGAYVVDI